MLVATAVLAGLGLVSGLGLAVAARFFAVEVDPRQEEIADLMPGANCGGCGLAGCGDFARAVVAGEMAADACPVGGDEVAKAVAAVMGVAVAGRAPRTAFVHCQGTEAIAPRRFAYNGMASCASAALLGGGDKACTFGCLGYGDCAEACAFDAIAIVAGVASVMPERCTACGRCVEACPKGIIDLVPAVATIHVLCSSHDKGPVAKKACERACIGCKKCEKFAGSAAIAIEDFLASVNYDDPPTDPAIVDECSMRSIVALAGDGGERAN